MATITKKKQRGRPAQSAAKKEEIRAKIVSVSKELFINEGFENISIRKIAQQAGCIPRTIYYYFENKRELLHYLWVDIFKTLSSECERAIKSLEAPLEIIHVIYTTYVNYWLAHRDQYRVIFMIEDLNATSNHDTAVLDMIKSSAKFIRIFEKAINDCIQNKVFKEKNTNRVVQVFFLSAHGLASGIITMREMKWENPDALIKSTLNALITGLE
ncbi:MAG: TetR/AcrR family transcriptional regulator [Desulfobacteraceae bacterium]|nr:TetR/AcrR family transcriptional regulator [Desulfobacteraceae bacterium]MBC2757760.1 TetR/AcrR family transcriptional regulator [Desulfobacteraceae bacterium]